MWVAVNFTKHFRKIKNINAHSWIKPAYFIRSFSSHVLIVFAYYNSSSAWQFWSLLITLAPFQSIRTTPMQGRQLLWTAPSWLYRKLSAPATQQTSLTRENCGNIAELHNRGTGQPLFRKYNKGHTTVKRSSTARHQNVHFQWCRSWGCKRTQ